MLQKGSGEEMVDASGGCLMPEFIEKKGKTLLMDKKMVELTAKKEGIKLGNPLPFCWLGVPVMIQEKMAGVIGIQNHVNQKVYDSSEVALFEMIAHEIGIFIERQQILDELILSKEKAEENDRLKSAFLANMSHEIRTPMNGILGFAELLKEPGLTGDQQQKYLNVIEKSGLRMLSIINDIIDIAKIESGQMSMNWQQTDVNELLEYICAFFKPDLESKCLKLVFHNKLPDSEARIITDRDKLLAVFTNLVKNAIKFTDFGSVELGYHQKGDGLEFYVKDTGMGIPENRLQAIFERFVQADIDDNMARQGAGLGLSITKAYIEMMGGRIWAESTEGKGSVFYFHLPLRPGIVQDEYLDTSGKFTGKYQEKNDRRLKILIAEDDVSSEYLLGIIIRKLGKEIFVAHNGTEAVETCRNNPDIDLILMDMKMPGLSGFEATSEIRKFNTSVIIIAQTAYGLQGDREKALAAGCNDYIAKPFPKEDLLNLILKYF